MTVSTYIPDADGAGGATSCDGRTRYSPGSAFDWDTGHGAADGTAADDNSANTTCRYHCSTTTNKFSNMFRSYFLFDTSDIPDGNVVSAATLSVTGLADSKTDSFSESMTVVLTSPASNTAIVVGDWSEVGSVHQSDDVAVSSMSDDDETPTVFTLNSTGRGNISLNGISKFGVGLLADVDDSEPTWGSDNLVQMNWASADESLSGDQRPLLTVTHAQGFTPRAIIF